MKTEEQYDQIIKECSTIFSQKNKDYGTSWRVLRLTSITDQLLIKARRIRQIQEAGEQKVDDSIEQDFKGIINYCVMALIQLESSSERVLGITAILKRYDFWISEAKNLMKNKNHDYGEVWRDMRVSSITDLILMKLLRVKKIEDNGGRTLVSEGVEANYLDMINYAVFSLILLNEEKESQA